MGSGNALAPSGLQLTKEYGSWRNCVVSAAAARLVQSKSTYGVGGRRCDSFDMEPGDTSAREWSIATAVAVTLAD